MFSGCLVCNVISKASERLWLTSISGINRYKVGTVGMSSCTMQSYGLGNDHFLSSVQSVFRVYLSTRSRASWGAGNFSKGKCLQVKGKKSPIGCAQADHCHHCLVAADRRPVCAIASVFEQRFSARLSSVPMSDHSRPLRRFFMFLGPHQFVRSQQHTRAHTQHTEVT